MAAMGNRLTQRRREAEVAEKVRLGDVCNQVRGVSYKPHDARADAATGYIPLLRANNIGTNGLNHDELVYVKCECVHEDQYVQKGDLLVCASSGSRHLVGKAAQIRFERRETFGAFCKVVRPDAHRVDFDYLSNYFQSDVYRRTIADKSAGANINNIRSEHLDDLQIPLPSLPEQKRIAATLDRICELKKNAETRLAKLDLLVKSRFVEMFGEGKYPEVTIESLAAHEKNAFKAGPFGSSLKKEFYVESGYKIYGQEQVISGDANYGNYYIDEAKYKTLESCKIQEGDVLVSLVGTYGKTLVIPHSFRPGIINPRLIKLTFDKERISPIYFQQFFSLDSTRDMLDRNCHGCTMGVLNLGIIKALKIPLPPLALQREFAAFVEKVEKLKEIAKRSAEQMDVLYRSKLQEYFG